MSAAKAEGKSLAARLFAVLFVSAFLSFAVATAIAAYASWTVYEGDAEERLTAQLETVAEQIRGLEQPKMQEALAGIHLADTRLTLVSGDGTVLYDSLVDARQMENHSNREEIQAARKLGESVVTRRSETTGTDALYAASLMNSDGVVLRLSESRTSLAYYLGGLLLPLSAAVLVAAAISALLARALTRRITLPMLQVNLDDSLQSETYREIAPLLQRIEAQRSELVSQNQQLARAVEMRREFTGNVSHEMKSPLQVIGGYAELIEGGVPSPEETRRFAALIRSESQSMRGLIDDVLTLSRLDEKALGEMRVVDVSAVASRVVERLSGSAEAKGVQVNTSLTAGALAVGDESLIEQAVYNLVDNAIRYGSSRVQVDVFADEEATAIAVSDDGAGVPEEQRERVFERFYRVDSSRSRSTGGTGLGLAIVKHAAESLGGSVRVGDSPMGGACFVLELGRKEGL